MAIAYVIVTSIERIVMKNFIIKKAYTGDWMIKDNSAPHRGEGVFGRLFKTKEQAEDALYQHFSTIFNSLKGIK